MIRSDGKSIPAQLQLHADIYIHSDGLSDNDIRRALLTPLRHAQDAALNLLGELEPLSTRYGPRLCIIPNGPQIIPTLNQR